MTVRVGFALVIGLAATAAAQGVDVPRDTIIRYVESKRNAVNSNQYKYKPFEKNLDFLTAINGPAS